MSENFEHIIDSISDTYEQDSIFLEFKDEKIEKDFIN